MSDVIERVEDRLADFTRDRRIVVLSWMALVVGALSAFVAYVLVWLIAVITNLAFYQRFSSVFQSPNNHRLGYFVILVPVIGLVQVGAGKYKVGPRRPSAPTRASPDGNLRTAVFWSRRIPCANRYSEYWAHDPNYQTDS